MAKDKESERKKSLESALRQINKSFGKGTFMRLGDRVAVPIDAIPTGSLGLDLALGVGGVPKGRVIEIYGPESSGKTTLTLHVIAEAQKKGQTCAFIDAEHALDVGYTKNLGVDTDNLYISQPDYGEQALDIVETVVRSGAIDLVVIDSVAALIPKAELDGTMDDLQVGAQARLMSKALRKLVGVMNQMSTTVIFINQIRMKIGAMGYGSPETTTGGNALKFFASCRLDVRKIANLKSGEDTIGSRTKVKVVKNKVAPPFKQVEFDIMYGTGISADGELLDYAIKFDIVDKSGAWFSYGSRKLGQGKENAKKAIAEDAKLKEEIQTKVKEGLGIGGIFSSHEKQEDRED